MDKGGGIPKVEQKKIFLYSFSTVHTQDRPYIDRTSDELTLKSSRDDYMPMAGFGYGLPLSRLHARYFGGDLQVVSMDGYGTDTFIYLKFLNV